MEAVLTAGARLLAVDPGASIASIAAAAGVDRRTVHRRFACREALLLSVYEARLGAIEEVIARARLREAPVEVALRRFVEGVVEVNRTWPVDLTRMLADAPSRARRDRILRDVEAFFRRAADEGLLRPGLPPGWAASLVPLLVREVSQNLPHLGTARAADVAVDAVLHGIGAERATSGAVPRTTDVPHVSK
ncbi:TetR family transcriptional regulator [Streptomyces sp. NPDC026672]|uniref:TetR family transcriptional regulator n=1 Tax=unclassified Streptomyces TaxID=2593676 RepID=UPI0033DDF42F